MKLMQMSVIVGALLAAMSGTAVAQGPYTRGELMSISRASQPLGRVAIWEGQTGLFPVQFGPQDISWLVVVAPTGHKRNGRVFCDIANVTVRSYGQVIYPSKVGVLPAHGGVQAYYRINQGEGRPVEAVTVSIAGNTFVHNNCPTNIHAVRGPFQPSEFGGE